MTTVQDSQNIAISVIIPTFNEKENLKVLIPQLKKTLAGFGYEIVIVDDNSPDGTSEWVRTVATTDRSVRIIQRYNRRGLSSAVIEGILASSGDCVVVMDADLQHDETRIPLMIEKIVSEGYAVISASRFLDHQVVLGLSPLRQKMSAFANQICNWFLPRPMTDPMTGFFAMKRSAFAAALPNLSPMGFKILFDILVSHPSSSLKCAEIPFQFRERHSGESKLDTLVAWEFLIYLLERLLGRRVSGAFISFSIIGSVGVLFHLLVLQIYFLFAEGFVKGHIVATAMAIGFNFFLNDRLTYTSQRLKGSKIFRGLLTFYAICSIGALANVGVASFIHQFEGTSWVLSALAGIAVGVFWNFGMSRVITWKKAE